jgi:hypothetical protein
MVTFSLAEHVDSLARDAVLWSAGGMKAPVKQPNPWELFLDCFTDPSTPVKGVDFGRKQHKVRGRSDHTPSRALS